VNLLTSGCSVVLFAQLTYDMLTDMLHVLFLFSRQGDLSAIRHHSNQQSFSPLVYSVLKPGVVSPTRCSI
jgi:hypothetical protein